MPIILLIIYSEDKTLFIKKLLKTIYYDFVYNK